MDTFPIYSPVVLLGNLRAASVLPMFWRNLVFSGAPVFSDDREIEFSKFVELRVVAPFVSPESDGISIYNNRETVQKVRTAYIKLIDAVRAHEFTGRLEVGAGELGHQQPLTPTQRWQYRTAEIARQHQNAIEATLEIMCFQAVSSGIVTVRDAETNVATNVNFGRHPSHTITLAGGALWSAAGSKPLDDISNWKSLARRPKDLTAQGQFGMAPTYWIMGSTAAQAFRTNPSVKAELDKNFERTSQTRINTGVLDGADIELIGILNDGSQVWLYNEYTQNRTTGAVEAILDPRDVIGVNPAGVNGVVAYGAIANFKANLASLAIFPNMFMNQSGSEVYLTHESAPMVIPVNPNATLRARVV